MSARQRRRDGLRERGGRAADEAGEVAAAAGPHPVIPPHVDYSLTPLGEEAARQVWSLARWVEERVPDVVAARDAYDAAKNS